MKKETKKKVLIGAGIVLVCVGGYFGYMYIKGINDKLLEVIDDNAELKNTVMKLEKENAIKDHKIDMIDAAGSEGLFQESIARLTKKLDYRQDAIRALKERKSWSDNAEVRNKLEKYSAGCAEINRRVNYFREVQKEFEIPDIILEE